MLKLSKINEKISNSFNETNDCVVRALANGCNMNYRQAHAILKRKGRKNRKGTPHKITINVFFQHSKGKIYIPSDYDHALEISKRSKKYDVKIVDDANKLGIDMQYEIVPKLLTISQFCRKYNKGRYLVIVRGHALAVVDGVPQDWTSTNSRHHIGTFFEVK